MAELGGEDLRRVFRQFDQDENGTLDFTEFASIFLNVGRTAGGDILSERDLQTLRDGGPIPGLLRFFNRIDVTRRHSINLDEFINMVDSSDYEFKMALRNLIRITPEEIQQIFNIFDTDGDGNLSADDLFNLYSNLGMNPRTGQPATDAQLRTLMRGARNDNNLEDISDFFLNECHFNFLQRLRTILDVDNNNLQRVRRRGITESFFRSMNPFETGYSGGSEPRRQLATIPATEPAGVPAIDRNMIISNGVSIAQVLDAFREYQTVEQLTGVTGNRDLSIFLSQSEDIHAGIYRTINIETGFNLLRRIANGVRQPSDREILQTFQAHLTTGARIWVERRIVPVQPLDGIMRAIQHLLHDRVEGLQGWLRYPVRAHSGGRSFNRNIIETGEAIHLINQLLGALSQLGQVGNILIAYYTKSYVENTMCAYEGNTLTRFINGVPPTPGGFTASCMWGNADRSILAINKGIEKGLREISLDPAFRRQDPAPAPAPDPAPALDANAEARDARFAQLIGEGLSDEDALDVALIDYPQPLAPPRLNRQNSRNRGANNVMPPIPPNTPPFPEYVQGRQSSLPLYNRITRLASIFKANVDVYNLNSFKNWIRSISQDRNVLDAVHAPANQTPAEFLNDMATALYAPGGGDPASFEDNRAENYVDYWELDTQNFWDRLTPETLGGKRKKTRKARHGINRSNTKKHFKKNKKVNKQR